MFNRRRERRRTLATLAAMGLGMAVLRKMSFRRYMLARMLMGGGFGRRGFGPWGAGRFGGYGPWAQGDFSQFPIPPFMEARLKAWHDQAHGSVPPPASQPSDATKV